MTDQPATPDADRSPLGAFAPVVRRWPLLLLLAVAGGVLGFLGFSLQKPVYESAARIQVSKRYDANAGDGRMVYQEDYVATMTQIIVSDEVLKTATLRLKAAALAEDKDKGPAADEEADLIARLDRLKAGLVIVRVRDPNAVATTSSSVLTLKYAAGDPGDAKTILDAVVEAVQEYLKRGFSEAVKAQSDEVSGAIDRKQKDRDALRTRTVELRTKLTDVTTEELAVLRTRVSANFERAFALELDLIKLDGKLKGIEAVGKAPAARQAKLRELTGLLRTPGEAAGPTGPETVLLQLTARRMELTERMGKDHPTLKEVDGQIKFYQELAGRALVPSEAADELALYEGRLREDRAAADLQKSKVRAQSNDDDDKLRRGGRLQDEAELYRRQVDEVGLELLRLEDRQKTLKDIQTKTADSSRAYDARELDKPRIGRKVGPSLPTWLLPGVVLGLLAGVALAFLAEMADQSFRSPAEIRRRLGVPVFGHIPPIRLDQPATADVSAAYDPVLVAARRPKSVEAELYRGVRTQVLVATAAAGHTLIQVTSPNPGDGKSTTAANLAISLAQAGKRVALIDADFRKPRVHALFALAKPEVGLASVVDGTADLDAAIRPCDVDNLFLLPCGPRPTNPAELLAGERFAAILTDLKGKFDHVVIDTPPLLVVSDPLVVAQRADAVVLVFGITRRSRGQVERARELLADTGANLIGVVVNGVDGPAGGYSAGAYKYGYHYEYQYTDQYADDADASRT